MYFPFCYIIQVINTIQFQKQNNKPLIPDYYILNIYLTQLYVRKHRCFRLFSHHIWS